MNLSVVTGMIDPSRTEKYWRSWRVMARGDYEAIAILNGVPDAKRPEGFNTTWAAEVLGPVPAFVEGVAQATGEVIACLHDDIEIEEPGWDEQVLRHFEEHPAAGLLGFSGCDGLGAEDIYRVPYDPMQLARVGFFSNMREAEKHGRRETGALRSAACDGFSLVGRAEFMKAAFQHFTDHGIIHHAYDGWLSCLARRQGLEVWFLPVRCHHAGGVSAVAAQEYQRWAGQGGDQKFWQYAHHQWYEDCRGELPVRVR